MHASGTDPRLVAENEMHTGGTNFCSQWLKTRCTLAGLTSALVAVEMKMLTGGTDLRSSSDVSEMLAGGTHLMLQWL